MMKRSPKKGKSKGKREIRYTSLTKSVALPAASGLVRDVKPVEHMLRDHGEDTFGTLVIPNNTTTGKVVRIIDLSPNSWSGSFIQRVTSPFQQYAFDSLRFTFVPFGTFSTAGAIKMIYLPDPDDSIAIGSLDTTLSGLRYTSTPIYLSATMDISKEVDKSWHWLTPTPTEEYRLTSSGKLIIVYMGSTTTSEQGAGELTCSWTVRYRKPAPPSVVGQVMPFRSIQRVSAPVTGHVTPLPYPLTSFESSAGTFFERGPDINSLPSTMINTAHSLLNATLDTLTTAQQCAERVRLTARLLTPAAAGSILYRPYLSMTFSGNHFANAPEPSYTVYIMNNDSDIQYTTNVINGQSRAVLYASYPNLNVYANPGDDFAFELELVITGIASLSIVPCSWVTECGAPYTLPAYYDCTLEIDQYTSTTPTLWEPEVPSFTAGSCKGLGKKALTTTQVPHPTMPDPTRGSMKIAAH